MAALSWLIIDATIGTARDASFACHAYLARPGIGEMLNGNLSRAL